MWPYWFAGAVAADTVPRPRRIQQQRGGGWLWRPEVCDQVSEGLVPPEAGRENLSRPLLRLVVVCWPSLVVFGL